MADEPRRFFVDEKLLRAKNVTLTGDLAHRLAKVLRHKRGDTIVLAAGAPKTSSFNYQRSRPTRHRRHHR